MSLFDKFKTGLSLSSLNFSKGIKDIFSKKMINESVLSEFEDLLISSDTGIEVAQTLRKDFEKFRIDKKLMSFAKKDCTFLHCLPRGMEVEDKVFKSDLTNF